MTLETQVAELTSATTKLLDTVNVGKAELDTAKSAAQTSAANAAASEQAAGQHKADAQTAKTAAEAARDAAQTAESNAVAVVTGGTASLTAEAGKIPIADAKGKIDPNWLDHTIPALNAQYPGLNVVDVCFYDTTKDSDPSWVHRATSASLYQEPLNTAVRGSAQAFPSAMTIVATATQILIYGATDSHAAMWKIFNVEVNSPIFATPKAVAAMEGCIFVATSSGLVKLNLLGDRAEKYTTGGVSKYKGSLAAISAGWL